MRKYQASLRWSFGVACFLARTGQTERLVVINKGAPWLAIVLLFFSSLVPCATRIVSAHFMSVETLVFYGLTIIWVTLANLILYRSVLGDAPRNRLLFWNVLVKLSWG